MNRSRLACLLLVLLALPRAGLAGDLSYEERAPSRNEALLRSALWPGLGQIEQGRTARGAVWAGGAALLAVSTFFSHSQYHSAAMDFENAQESYERAVADGWQDLAVQYMADMKDFHGLADDRRGIRTSLEVGLALWWAGSLVDTWLFAGEPAAEGAAASGALPGRLEPVLRGRAAGLAWTVDF